MKKLLLLSMIAMTTLSFAKGDEVESIKVSEKVELITSRPIGPMNLY